MRNPDILLKSQYANLVETTQGSLDLSSKVITTAEMELLANELRDNTTINEIKLKFNKVEKKAIEAILEVFKTNTTLISVIVHGEIESKEKYEINNLYYLLGAYINRNKLLSNDSKYTTYPDSFRDTIYKDEYGDSNKQIEILAEGIERNTTVTQFYLKPYTREADNEVAISKAFQENNKATALFILEYAKLGLGELTIGDALKHNTTLTQVSLSFSSISDKGVYALGEALKTNTTLTHLILKGPTISYQGMKAIGEGLKDNTTLTELNLDIVNESHKNDNYNKNNSALGALAKGLKYNTGLKTLKYGRYNDDIYDSTLNNINLKGLGDALKENNTLTSLVISSLSLNESNLSEDLGYLITRTNCKQIEIRTPVEYHARGLVTIAESLKSNTTLTKLDLTYAVYSSYEKGHDKYLSVQAWEKINKYLKRNKSIEENPALKLKPTNKNVSKKIGELTVENEELKTKIEELENGFIKFKDELKNIKQELQNSQSRVKELEKEITKLHEGNKVLKQQNTEKDIQLSNLQKENNSLKSVIGRHGLAQERAEAATTIQALVRGHSIRKVIPLEDMKAERKKEIQEAMKKLMEAGKYSELSKLATAMEKGQLHTAMQIIRGIPEKNIEVQGRAVSY